MARRTGPRWGRIAGLGLCAFVIGSLAGWIFGGADDATVSTADPTTTTLRADGGTDAPPSTGATSTTVDPAAPVRDQIGAGQPVTFVFGGDIHFDGPLATTLANAPDSILAGLQPTLSDADVAVVNLETAIGTGGTKAAKEFNFRASPAAFGALTSAGVDVIGMANNHALDLLTPETAAHWADAFLKLLSGLVAEPERPLAERPEAAVEVAPRGGAFQPVGALNLALPLYVHFCHWRGREPVLRLYFPVVVVAMFWAISIHTVTAFLFSANAGRPFWHTSLLGPRFIASAFASGPARLPPRLI